MRTSRYAIYAFSLAALIPFTHAWAQTVEEDQKILLRQLEVQVETLQKDIENLKKADPDKRPQIVLGPGPQISSADGRYSFRIRGRLDLDAAFFSDREGTRDFNDGTQVRRARIGAEGVIDRDFKYRVELEFANASRDDRDGQEVDLIDAYLAYAGFENFIITVGQHKTPNSLERLQSANYLTFAERSMVIEAFTHRTTAGGDRKIGVSVGYLGGDWTLTIGAFGENASVTHKNGADEGWGPAGRFTIAPIHSDKTLLHLGASAYWRDTGTREQVRLRSAPEAGVDGVDIVDTGILATEDYYFIGAEAASVYGPFSVQGEYSHIRLNPATANAQNLDFDGAYLFVSYFLTGESRPYKDGVFERLKPIRNFSLKEDGFGAWEIAARYSTIDLNDQEVLGGTADNWTMALNWYLNPYVRLSANWVRFDSKHGTEHTDGDAALIRLNVNW